MKACRIPLLILSIILSFSLWVSYTATKHCSEWVSRLNAMETQAMAENWLAAEQILLSLSDGWEHQQVLLHILIPHDELDSAEMLLSQCRLHSRQKDTASLCNAVSQLRCQFLVLAETEQFSLKNVL